MHIVIDGFDVSKKGIGVGKQLVERLSRHAKACINGFVDPAFLEQRRKVCA